MSTWHPFNRRVVAYIFCALAIALAVNAFRIHQPTSKAALLPAKVVPYTVVLEEFWLQRDGTAVPSGNYTEAIRGDGSRAFEATNSNPANPPFSERILDFSSGGKMYIFHPKELKTTTFDPAKIRAATWLRYSGSNCVMPGFALEKPGGEEVINGYRTVKLINGEITEWHALDYGCALIKGRYEWPDGQTISEKRLVALTPGEPASSLFDDPGGLEEVPFSRWLGPEAGPDARAGSDAYYESHRPPVVASRPR